MFCPNCGEECLDVKICPRCGQMLISMRETDEQTLEQFACPECGSTKVTAVIDRKYPCEYRLYRSVAAKLLVFIDNIIHAAFRKIDGQEHICLRCGYKWYPKRVILERQYQKHLTTILKSGPQLVVPTSDGFDLCFNSYGVVIYKNNKYKLGIPYNQITAVRYQESFGTFYGWLSIRYVENQNCSFPASYVEAQKDKTTYLFDFSYNDAYLEIYSALDAIVEENKKAGLF